MKIGIIGYGWLAKQIAPILSDQHEIYSFSRSAQLREKHFIVDWSQPALWPKAMAEVDFFLLMLPPRDAQSVHFIYQNLLKLYPKAKGILCSSTGVYTALQSERKQRLLDIESIFNKSSFQIVRLGGLIGPNRNLAQLMSGRPVEARERVRFIHCSEIATFILQYLSLKPPKTAPFAFYHPITCTKKAWYTQFQEALGMELSLFKDENPNLQEVPLPDLPMEYNWIWEDVLNVSL